MRVLHAPVNVGNQPWVLSRYERAHGVQSDLVVNYSTWLAYPADRCLSKYGDRSLQALFSRSMFALSAPFRYDVLHYYFGRSLTCWDDFGRWRWFWYQDLRLARRLGKKVFMTLQGCDVRLSDRSAEVNEITPCHDGNCQLVPECRATIDDQRRDLIANILPLVDRVFVLNPELRRYVPNSEFLPYCSVDIEAFTPEWPKADGPAVILHAPSDPLIKGSRYIIEAVERLKARYPIEFVLVQGLEHAEALRAYRRADLVIDQVLAGWYGGLAVEAMALGKPVMCYVRSADLDLVPAGMRDELPFLQAGPQTIEQSLEQALLRRQEWAEWGRRARAYVERWHDPRRIAGAMIAAYERPDSQFILSQ